MDEVRYRIECLFVFCFHVSSSLQIICFVVVVSFCRLLHELHAHEESIDGSLGLVDASI